MGLGSWSFVVCDRGGVPISEPVASRRQYNPAVSASETASFGVQIGSPLWDQIQAYDCTLKVYDSFQNLVFYGEILSDELVGTGQGGTVEVSAVDVSFRLQERFVGKDATGVGLQYVNQDARAIAFDLLGLANAEEATGIVPGEGNVGLSTAAPFVPAPTTFGHNTLGAGQLGMAGDFYKANPSGHANLQVTKYTLEERATLTALNVDVESTPGVDHFGGMFLRFGVYADAGGGPGALIAQTAERHLSWPTDPLGIPLEPRQWVNLPLLTTPTLEPGNYWMGYIGGESSQQVALGFSGGGVRAIKQSPYSAGLPSSFGAPSFTDSVTWAIYADITTAAPPPPDTSFVGPTVTYLWKNLLDAVSELGALADSYEWKLRYADGTPPTVYLDLMQQVGEDRSAQVFFEYGTGQNNCSGFRRIRSQQRRATRVYGLGTGQTLTAVAFDAAAEAAPYARAEDVLPVGDITDVTLLDALAAQHVAIRKTPRTVASFTLAPHIGPKYGQWVAGDYVTGRAKVENEPVVDGKVRVWGAQIQIDEEGNESAQPTTEVT